MPRRALALTLAAAALALPACGGEEDRSSTDRAAEVAEDTDRVAEEVARMGREIARDPEVREEVRKALAEQQDRAAELVERARELPESERLRDALGDAAARVERAAREMQDPERAAREEAGRALDSAEGELRRSAEDLGRRLEREAVQALENVGEELPDLP